MVNTFPFKYFCTIWLCISALGCHKHNKLVQRDSIQVSNKDTLVFNGCQKKITAQIGSIIELQMEAVPVIGYEWLQIESLEIIKEHKTDIVNYINKGDTSFQVLYFEAIEKGSSSIQLEYKRVFENNVKKTCKILIEIY